MSSAIGYKDGQTDDLWMLVVYGDKKADKDAAVLSVIHNAAEDVSEEGFFISGQKSNTWDYHRACFAGKSGALRQFVFVSVLWIFPENTLLIGMTKNHKS